MLARTHGNSMSLKLAMSTIFGQNWSKYVLGLVNAKGGKIDGWKLLILFLNLGVSKTLKIDAIICH
jgi:hypothetical protein